MKDLTTPKLRNIVGYTNNNLDPKLPDTDMQTSQKTEASSIKELMRLTEEFEDDSEN